MKKFRVVDAKGEKTFLSISSIKRWYSVSLENASDTNHSDDAFFYSRSYISFGKLRFCLYLSYVFVNDKAYKTETYNTKTYKTGTYKTTSNIHVRTGPGTKYKAKTYKQLTY